MEPTAPQDLAQAKVTDLVEAGARDSEVFYRAFFPRTFRQASPQFQLNVDSILDAPAARYCNLLIFRGGGKTTKLRAFTGKRIAYGLAHTVLYIGKSEGHAVRSIRWIKRQVEYNKLYAGTFGLKQGRSWTDTEIEIKHEVAGFDIRVLGMGITGSVRGINEDDFRPDLIVLDDVLDDENCETPEQRKKISKLISGAVMPSLAPVIDAPDAKLVSLCTPQHRDDFAMRALTSKVWRSARYGVWTEETEDRQVENQVSRWESRHPTRALRELKADYVAKNELSVWLKEYEIKLINPETTKFKPHWLNFYHTDPVGGINVVSIDPVPPPKASALEKGELNPKGDFEVLAAVKLLGGNRYIMDIRAMRGHEPDWTISNFFQLCGMYDPVVVVAESVAYQATLQWLLRKAMDHNRRWYYIKDTDSVKSKPVRIVGGLKKIAVAGKLWCHPRFTDFIEQFNNYPGVTHDDVIEAVANACVELEEWTAHDEEETNKMAGTALEDRRPQTLGIICP